jgi:hypothetical protein
MQLMQRRQMTIFISYAHEDAQVASEIAAALDSLGLRPWIDEREVQPGESFLKRMSEGLSAADYVVVLFSGASLRSHWVEREWMSSLARRDPIVVPVRLDTSEIPVLIRDLVWIDFVPSSEQGIEKLKSFFLRELETTGSAGERRTLSPQPSQTMPLWERSRHQLRLVTMSCMKETEFQSYLYDTDIDQGEIQGPSFNQRILWLLNRLKDGNLSSDFAKWLYRERKECVVRALARLAESEPPPGSPG